MRFVVNFSLSGVSSGLASLSSLLGGRRTTQQVSIPADVGLFYGICNRDDTC